MLATLKVASQSNQRRVLGFNSSNELLLRGTDIFTGGVMNADIGVLSQLFCIFKNIMLLLYIIIG